MSSSGRSSRNASVWAQILPREPSKQGTCAATTLRPAALARSSGSPRPLVGSGLIFEQQQEHLDRLLTERFRR